MFVESVETRAFGKLDSIKVPIINGKVVVRGSNEAGKSTLIEAILYCMFGSSALRGTVEDAVTEGSKPSDLRVRVKYGPYTAKRTKSSASVVGPDVKINGQSNVSEFFYDLLGVRKGTERSILVSEQGKTAGILDGKPGEVSALIESLAGFSHIDDLIERVKEKFPSGNKSFLEEMLIGVDDRIEEKNKIILTNPEVYREKVRHGEANRAVAEQEVEALQSSISGNEHDLAEIEASVKLKSKLMTDLQSTEMGIDTNSNALTFAKEASKKEVPDVTAERSLVDDYAQVVETYKLYKEVTSFSWDGDEWDEGEDGLAKEVLGVSEKVFRDNEELADLRATKRKYEYVLADDEDYICSECGQDTSHLHTDIRDKAEKGLEDVRGKIDSLTMNLADHERYLQVLNDIGAEQVRRSLHKKYAVDTKLLPWTLKWPGKIPVEPSKVKFNIAQSAIAESESLGRVVDTAHADVVTLTGDVKKAVEKAEGLRNEISEIFPQDSSDLREIITALKKAHGEALEVWTGIDKQIKEDDKKVTELVIEAKHLENELDELTKQNLSLREKIKADQHNAEILKQVRKAKPVVLNRVWSSVLNTVSSTFSEMRAEESKVEKTEKGFSINGLPVHRLSGSAKSILGIAVRSALRDIFAPSAGFMVFDEPFADMDADRTALANSALNSIRGQVLMITHEEVSDGSFDDVIEV